jgi:hypothetical protein
MGKDDKFLPDGSVDYRARSGKKRKDLRYKLAIWNRSTAETDKEFHIYRVFRDMEPDDRDFQEYVFKNGYDLDYVNELYEKHNWEERIEAWDSSARSRLAARQAMEARKMKNNHAAVGSAMLAVAAKQLGRWNNMPPDADPMPVNALVNLAQTGVAIERLSRDLASDETTINVKSDVDASRLSTDDLLKLRELRKKARAVKDDE